MPVTIPESVFDKYFDVVDSTFTIFGVTCQLVLTETVNIRAGDPDGNIPTNNSINSFKKNPGDDFYRENESVEQVEVLSDIKLKVYWNSKDWVKPPSQGVVVPDNAIQTIFFATDLKDVTRAKALIVHKDIKDLQEMRFVRTGEPFPMGLRQERYFGCFWERA